MRSPELRVTDSQAGGEVLGHCLRTLLWAIVLGLSVSSALAQKPGSHGPPAPPPAAPPTPPTDTFDQNRLRIYGTKDAPGSKKPEEDTCYLPPLSVVHSPTVPTANLQAPAKAKKEYLAACAALKDRKYAPAEEHLRKAVQQAPYYPAAWITLGQLLAAQQKGEEAHKACSEALKADPSYVPAYLCVADAAARQNQWEDVLRASTRALELDPTTNAVAYDYHAAANLNLKKFDEAEKSALRAIEIDKNHADPRVHFLLAQVYDAKHDPANEATQLREYLKYATDPADAEMVKQYLAELEKRTGK